MTGIDIYRLVDGKIVEQWYEMDFTGLLQQLRSP
jgi:predicted SnoaL-like aldol condensation-catalyzing enzyme